MDRKGKYFVKSGAHHDHCHARAARMATRQKEQTWTKTFFLQSPGEILSGCSTMQKEIQVRQKEIQVWQKETAKKNTKLVG